MKILKKTVVLTALAAICASLPMLAAESSQYGKNLTQVSIDGRTVDGTFEDYMTEGDNAWKNETQPFNGTIFFDSGASGDRTAVAQITDEAARNGNNSLKFDMDALADCSTNADKSARLILQQNIKYSKPNVKYYYEAWVKLKDETKAELLDQKTVGWEAAATIRLDDYGDNGEYTNACDVVSSTTETDDNGWRKISITKECADTSGTLKIGPAVYNWNPSGEGVGTLYYDDITVYALPDSIRAEVPKNIYDTDEILNLADIKVYGKNASGEEEEFTDYGNIEYSVESGEAEISGGKLYYNGTENGNVILKINFIGVTCETTVKFGSPVKIYGISRNSDNSYRVMVGDVTSQGTEVTVIAAVFDKDNVMRKLTASEKTSIGNPSIINTPVVDTENIEQPTVKIFIWDSLSGMTPYSEIIEP